MQFGNFVDVIDKDAIGRIVWLLNVIVSQFDHLLLYALFPL